MEPSVDVAPALAIPTPDHSPLDLRMRRLLRLPVGGAASTTPESARRAFEVSVYVSAARCLLTYIVLPFIFPIIGVSAGLKPVIGLPVSAIAVVANVMSIRRFWRADHKYRWHYTALASAIIVAMLVLITSDLISLFD
ncbi:MAG: hypothetical protein M3Z03_13515 [Actinomycetota bacterium]|nr:hypothetical protein [Actinomycetota bacterium]